MKIAIATVEKNSISTISTRGGRAPYYLIFNENGELLDTISNPFVSGGGGAGVGVAKMLADINVAIVIAGAIGEKMEESLNKRDVKFYEKEGLAEEILKEFIKK